jgi:hypothetical protein
MQVGWSILLIIHGILAAFLVGAVTHQAIGVALSVARRGSGFFSAVRGVNGMNDTNAVVALIPDKLLGRVPWRSLSWLVHLGPIVYLEYVLLPYATKS